MPYEVFRRPPGGRRPEEAAFRIDANGALTLNKLAAGLLGIYDTRRHRVRVPMEILIDRSDGSIGLRFAEEDEHTVDLVLSLTGQPRVNRSDFRPALDELGWRPEAVSLRAGVTEDGVVHVRLPGWLPVPNPSRDRSGNR